MEPKELIGIDLGQKHSGIARASSIAKIAEPCKTVATDNLMEELNSLIKEKKIEAIAIGLPRNLKGEDTDQTNWTRKWVGRAKSKIKAPLFWVDEALTSKESDRSDEHSLAAASILQDFIDIPEADRVLC